MASNSWWYRLWHRHNFAEDCGRIAVPITRDTAALKQCACGLYGCFRDGRLQFTITENEIERNV